MATPSQSEMAAQLAAALGMERTKASNDDIRRVLAALLSPKYREELTANGRKILRVLWAAFC